MFCFVVFFCSQFLKPFLLLGFTIKEIRVGNVLLKVQDLGGECCIGIDVLN